MKKMPLNGSELNCRPKRPTIEQQQLSLNEANLVVDREFEWKKSQMLWPAGPPQKLKFIKFNSLPKNGGRAILRPNLFVQKKYAAHRILAAFWFFLHLAAIVVSYCHRQPLSSGVLEVEGAGAYSSCSPLSLYILPRTLKIFSFSFL